MPRPPKDEEIKVRVETTIKKAFQSLAVSEDTSESELARRAFKEYLRKRGLLPEKDGGYPSHRPSHLALNEKPSEPGEVKKPPGNNDGKDNVSGAIDDGSRQ